MKSSDRFFTAKSTLKSSFDSIVAARNLDEGTVIQAGQSILRLVENAPQSSLAEMCQAVRLWALMLFGLNQLLVRALECADVAFATAIRCTSNFA